MWGKIKIFKLKRIRLLYCFTAARIWTSTRKEMEKMDSGNISQKESTGLVDILDMVVEERSRMICKILIQVNRHIIIVLANAMNTEEKADM